jgi:hypothetical protein
VIAPIGHAILHKPHSVQVGKNSMVMVSCKKMLLVGHDPTQAAQCMQIRLLTIMNGNLDNEIDV